jgi:hypothetical protein
MQITYEIKKSQNSVQCFVTGQSALVVYIATYTCTRTRVCVHYIVALMRADTHAPVHPNATLRRSRYWRYPTIPPVDLLKYLEPRYLTQVCDRWSEDKTNIIQLAWFNGDGVETWQNIWGIWQGLTDRDAALLSRLGPMLRFFG